MAWKLILCIKKPTFETQFWCSTLKNKWPSFIMYTTETLKLGRTNPNWSWAYVFEKKRTKTREKSSFSAICEAFDYVIITQLLSCKNCMVLQDSCKTGVLVYHLARFALSCKTLARLASACRKLARIPCFVRSLQDNCKISISSKLGKFSATQYECIRDELLKIWPRQDKTSKTLCSDKQSKVT